MIPPSIHMAGLGVAICNYNNYARDTDVCRSDQAISQG